MLEELDRINWSSLTHAYGAAGDVPRLIRARGSTDSETANGAEAELFGNIWHQGTVYEASAYAVPFLIELLEAESTVERSGIVLLLASIANGHSYLEVHGSMRHYDDRRDTLEFQAKLKQELSWKEQSHEAVAKHVGFYWRLLDQDLTMSVCMPYLLAAIPGVHREVRARMPHRVAETESMARASALLAYAFACAGTGEGIAVFASLLEDADRWVAFGAAYGLVVSGRVTAELPRAFDVLLNPLRDSEQYIGPNDWFWGDGQTEAVAVDALGGLGSGQVEVLLPRLPDLLRALSAYGASDAAAACLKYAFAPNHLPASRQELRVSPRGWVNPLAFRRSLQEARRAAILDHACGRRGDVTNTLALARRVAGSAFSRLQSGKRTHRPSGGGGSALSSSACSRRSRAIRTLPTGTSLSRVSSRPSSAPTT